MSDLPVQHYLDIYLTRLRMVEKGIIRPKPKAVAGMRQLVSGLGAMQREAKVRLDSQSERCRFISAETGDLIAEIQFDDPAEPAQ